MTLQFESSQKNIQRSHLTEGFHNRFVASTVPCLTILLHPLYRQPPHLEKEMDDCNTFSTASTRIVISSSHHHSLDPPHLDLLQSRKKKISPVPLHAPKVSSLRSRSRLYQNICIGLERHITFVSNLREEASLPRP